VPAAVLAEGVFNGHVGHDHHVRQLLTHANIAPVDEPLGYTAGALRQAAIGAGMDPPPSGIDAVVAAEADVRAARDNVRILTTDHDDLELLASLAINAARLSVLAP
jgi:predicted nucleic acid-binding protein